MRDPYPAIGERAVGRWGRVTSLVAIALTLYGGCCVFIVLISQLLGSLVLEATGLQLSLCSWMVITGTYLDIYCCIYCTPSGRPDAPHLAGHAEGLLGYRGGRAALHRGRLRPRHRELRGGGGRHGQAAGHIPGPHPARGIRRLLLVHSISKRTMTQD